jgi:hypothetical protein
MHQKPTKHGRLCKQNNQLPTKSHVEFKDNSNSSISSFLYILVDILFHFMCVMEHQLLISQVTAWCVFVVDLTIPHL